MKMTIITKANPSESSFPPPKITDPKKHFPLYQCCLYRK